MTITAVAAQEFSVPFGIWADTGLPLNDLSESTTADRLHKEPEEEAVARASTFSALGELDANDLQQCGWGIMFAPGVKQEIKDALQPLILHRKQAAEPFMIYDGDSSILPGESPQDWLARHHVRLDVVDPAKGIPYYMLLVGPPDAIPFEFQYVLDLYWAVGRLWFETADEFRQYAESVVRYETASRVPTARQMTVFATEHEFDRATQLFTRNVVQPLCDGEGLKPTSIGKRQGFGLKTVLGEHATKASLTEILQGRGGSGTPSLLFTGSHGMAFRESDPRQASHQGAIVCQDWSGFGAITEKDWFSATDVPGDANIHGMMHILFACYGGGCPEFDNFDQMNNQPARIASKPFFSRLPSRLLSHPGGGALAVLAHIERAWAYSFQDDAGTSQAQGFREVIGRIIRGERIGQATDSFNFRWAALSVELSNAERALRFGAALPLGRLGRMWIARDDARNFMILGDPACRIRTQDLHDLV
jgi:Peptidase family C25